MNLLKTCLAVLAGFILAYILLPVQPAKAGGMVYVKRANIVGVNNALGGTIVGFSCAANGGEVECYIASQ